MSNEVYRARVAKGKRYEVHFMHLGRWHVATQTYRTRFWAKDKAKSFASLGHEAKVVDTRTAED